MTFRRWRSRENLPLASHSFDKQKQLHKNGILSASLRPSRARTHAAKDLFASETSIHLHANSYATVIVTSVSSLMEREEREEARIMSRITELCRSKQTAAQVASPSVCVWEERQVETPCSSPGFKGSPGRDERGCTDERRERLEGPAEEVTTNCL